MVKQIGKEIDANYILQTINQYSIFAKYLNISEKVIKDSVKYKTNISSPLRIDVKPSVGFKYSGNGDKKAKTDFKYGKLRMRDFLAPSYQAKKIFWGDCFDLVGLRTNRDITRGIEFNYVLNHIYRTFNRSESNLDSIELDNIELEIDKSRVEIKYLSRKLNRYDYSYWNSNAITTDIFLIYGVLIIWKYWIDKDLDEKPSYIYNVNDPCYGYVYGKDENGIDLIELYHPYRDKKHYKHIANSDSIKGLEQLKDSDILVITKGMKEILILKTLSYYLFGSIHRIQAIAPPSESNHIPIDLGIYLMNKYKHRFSFMDYDYVGIKHMNYLKREFGFTPIFFKDQKPTKDLSDYSFKFGLNKLIDLAKNLIIQLNLDI